MRWLFALRLLAGCPKTTTRTFGDLAGSNKIPADAIPLSEGGKFARIALGNGEHLSGNLEWEQTCTGDGKIISEVVTKRGDIDTFEMGYPGMSRVLRVGDAFRYWTMEGEDTASAICDVRMTMMGAGSDDGAAGGIPAPDDVAAAPDDAIRTGSGLAYKVLEEGSGDARPTATGKVTVHYTGWTTDGKMFDSSIERGQPATFPLNGVIKGWTEGLQLMAKGEKARFWIPQELAYKGQPNKPAGMLVFDVTLLDFVVPLEEWDPPEYIAGIPPDAEVTPSGLASKVLVPAPEATDRPSARSTVTVHYVGYQTNGKQFDSSLKRGEPASFPLDKVIKGWTEGVQLMQIGEKRRFWVPPELAYQDMPNGPQGMLIFDVLLLDVQ